MPPRSDSIGLPSDLEKRIRFERVVTPVDWERKVDIYRGATFNLAHSFKQMLNLRPQNRVEDFDVCTAALRHCGNRAICA